MELFPIQNNISKFFCECAVPENIHTPPHGRSLEIPKGRGGSEAKISEGSGGLKSKLFSEGGKQFVTNEIILM